MQRRAARIDGEISAAEGNRDREIADGRGEIAAGIDGDAMHTEATSRAQKERQPGETTHASIVSLDDVAFDGDDAIGMRRIDVEARFPVELASDPAEAELVTDDVDL